MPGFREYVQKVKAIEFHKPVGPPAQSLAMSFRTSCVAFWLGLALCFGREAVLMVAHIRVHGIASGPRVGRAVDRHDRPVRRAPVAAHIRVVGSEPPTTDPDQI